MTKCYDCDYPVGEDSTIIRESVRDNIKQSLASLCMHAEAFIAKTDEAFQSIKPACETRCMTCGLKIFGYRLMSLIKNLEQESGSTAENDKALFVCIEVFFHSLPRLFALQFCNTVIRETSQKLQDKKGYDNIGLWVLHRLRRIEYLPEQHLTQDDKDMIATMRNEGFALRDIASVLDRSLSTIQEACVR